jgi:oligoribonuclease NrnB/cAMP/cGMP phosphodiesterase (DHH superfamily)
VGVLVFSHEQDVDGLFSAAILKIAFPDCEVMLTNYGLEKMQAVASKIESFMQDNKAPGTIIIADIGVNEESYSPVLLALQRAKEKGWKNIWVDHHIWLQEPRDKLAQVCEMVISSEEAEEMKKCTAELCTEKFAPDSRLARQLASIAHRTDFPDSVRFPIPPLTALISYYLGFPELTCRLHLIVESVARGVLWNAEMQDDIIEASRLIDESLVRSVGNMTIKEFSLDGYHQQQPARVAIAKSDTFVSRSMLLGKIMDDSDVDIAIAFTDDGKVSIRKKNDVENSFNCSEIAQEFREGGGHEGAAGGFLNRRPQDSSDGTAVDEIVSALESYFAKKKTAT